MDNLITKYNRRKHSIVEIYNDLKNYCPFFVTSEQYDEGYSVLVTQVVRDIAYGFPICRGARCFNGWYTGANRASVRIPDFETKQWEFLGMPYDDAGRILFKLDINGELDEPEPEPSIGGGILLYDENGRRANLHVQMPFGKYRGKTVREVLDTDPEYITWAMDNVNGFREKVYTL